MNLKERGITVGDLLVIVIIILSTLLIINKVKKSEEKAHSFITPIEILTSKNS